MAEVRIAVGRFVLQLGGPHGTRVDPGATVETSRGERLAEALRRPVSSLPAPAETASGLTAVADEVTRAVEQAEKRISAIAQGLTLDPRALSTQIDALVAVFERADREGRLADEVKLARSLATLLGLVGRWAILLEVLRRVASAAAAVGERAWEAWALHERGSLALAGGDRGLASDALNRALAQRNALGDEPGAALTLHNLRQLATLPSGGDRPPGFLRRRALALAVAAAIALAAGAAAIGYALAGGDDEAAATVPTTTAPSSTETGGGQTEPPDDTAPPTVGLEVPELSRGAQTLTADAVDDSGSVAVTFGARSSEEADFTELARVEQPPYVTVWETIGLADGLYVVRAAAADTAGNAADAQATTIVDNTAPEVAFGADVPPRALAGDTITVAGTVDDRAGSGVASVVVTIAPRPGEEPADGTPAGEVEPISVDAELGEQPATFTATVELSLPPGGYAIEVVATDLASNSRSTSRDLGVYTID